MAHHQPNRKGAGALPAKAPTEIPDKLYFRIGDVARLCDVPAYVLRFWESEFPQLKPNKGGTGQRLFRRRDVEVVLRIKCLLYDEGYTIPGARQLLRAEAKQKEPQLSLLADDPALAAGRDAQLQTLRQDLRSLLLLLNRPQDKAAGASAPGPRNVPARRNALHSVPVHDRLFDFPASTAAPAISPNDRLPESLDSDPANALTHGPESTDRANQD